MAEALMQPCAAAESSTTRGVRYVAAVLLVVFALAESAMATLLVAGRHGSPELLFLLCTLALLALALVAVRQRVRALLAVRVAAIAAAVMLFWSVSVGAVPSLSLSGNQHDMTPLLAGMLLGVVLLPALIKPRDSEAACNCQ